MNKELKMLITGPMGQNFVSCVPTFVCVAQRCRLAGGVVRSRTGWRQRAHSAGRAVHPGWSLQRVGAHQIHLWDTTQASRSPC